MRLAILSDIHGNIEALEAVITALKVHAPVKYVCLGDTVGYGASPNECCERVRELTDMSVIGNHDRGVFCEGERTFMNHLAISGIKYAAQTLTEENIQYLKGLPYTLEVGSDVILSHGLPDRPENWLYSDNSEQSAKSMLNCTQKLMFVGHLHVPHGFVFDEANKRLRAHVDEEIDISSLRHLINVGSVGQPRDGNPKASVAILDTDTLKVSILRVEYNVEAAANKIIKAGLPGMLADRIRVGR